jgi:pimeloyl-ACP methyl ester carboxylesterase
MLVGPESPDWAVRSTSVYADALPYATVHALEGQGHGATLSGPELIAAEVRGFLG